MNRPPFGPRMPPVEKPFGVEPLKRLVAAALRGYPRKR
jgi:hypothetical protein